MSQRTVARRYASALYQEAQEAGDVEAVDEDVRILLESLGPTDPLSRFFESPVIPQEKKDAVVQTLLADRVEDLTLRFLRLLIRKDRESLTKAILNQYQTIRDEERGIVDAYVTVARPLDEDDRGVVTEALEKHTGKTVRLHVDEDSDLIGGLIIQVGDYVFDASLRNKLSNLHDRLRESPLSLNVNGQIP